LIVTPDAVRAAIEVKTDLNGPKQIREAINKAAENKNMWHKVAYGWDNWIGVFVYDADEHHDAAVLKAMYDSNKKNGVNIDCVALGNDILVYREGNTNSQQPSRWVSRKISSLAPAYFISHLIRKFCEKSIYASSAAWLSDRTLDGPIKYIEANGDGIIQNGIISTVRVILA
jgi:hypothetical protein